MQKNYSGVNLDSFTKSNDPLKKYYLKRHTKNSVKQSKLWQKLKVYKHKKCSYITIKSDEDGK
jgi:hypothetical protein